MQPTSNQPYGSPAGSASPAHGTTPHSAQTSPADPHFSTTAAHATGDTPYPTDSHRAKPAATGVQSKIEEAVASGKKWLHDSGLADKAQQLPQAAKDLSNKALTTVNGLTTTQKAVGLGLLAVGIAFLAGRGGKKKKKSDDGDYRRRPRRSPFDHQPHTKDGDYAYDRRGQRPFGNSRYGTTPAPAGKARVSVGSGYDMADHGNMSAPRRPQAPTHSADHGRPLVDRHAGAAPGGSPRRDQGPAAGSHYDPSTSGSENPNNLDQLSSAY